MLYGVEVLGCMYLGSSQIGIIVSYFKDIKKLAFRLCAEYCINLLSE